MNLDKDKVLDYEYNERTKVITIKILDFDKKIFEWVCEKERGKE